MKIYIAFTDQTIYGTREHVPYKETADNRHHNTLFKICIRKPISTYITSRIMKQVASLR